MAGNAELFARLIERGFNNGDLSVADELCSQDLIEHEYLAPRGVSGPAILKGQIQDARRAVSDLTLTIEDLVEDRDRIWARMRATGREARTEQAVTFTVVDIGRCADGELVEHWGVPDRFALLHQVGALGWHRLRSSSMSMSDLLGRYRRAFVAGDLEALLQLFAFPVQSIGVDADGGTVIAMERDRWGGVLESILAAYERLGVRDAEVLEQETWEPLPGARQVRVHWVLQRGDGTAVYDFTAGYTVIGSEGQHRIATVLHDEAPKLGAALAALTA